MYILSIDLLRGFSALAVAWFHITQAGLLHGGGPFFDSGRLCRLGYYTFFITSGFVIPWSLYTNQYTVRNYFRFVAKRLIRLEPPYLLSIVVILVLSYFSSLTPIFRGPRFQIDPVYVLLHVGYLNVFTKKPWLSPVYWTLAVEFQYYLCMGLFYALLISRNRSVRYCSYLIPLVLYLLFHTHDAFIFKYLPLFMLGFLVFQKKTGIIGRREYCLVSAPLILTTAAYHGSMPLISLLAVSLIFWHRVKWRGGVFLGKISYSLYLLHGPIGVRTANLGSRFAHTDLEKTFVLAAAIFLSIVAATLFYKFVEKPAILWSKRISYQ